MTDKRIEIEGTPQRAADRGQPDGFTFFAEPTGADQRYLGDRADVESIVSQFFGEVHAIRSDAGHGRISGSEAMEKLHGAANRYAGIFHGAEPQSFRSMPFNTPEGLGAFVNQRLGMSEPDDKAVAVLFMSAATQLLAAYDDHQSGVRSDEDVRFAIDAALEDTTDILLGLPASSE